MKGIYKITNPEGKVYIGQSIDIDRRFREHKRVQKGNSGRKIIGSLKKYGPENHQFEILEECEIPQLHEREYFWKKFYTSVENGLNCDYFDNSGGPRSEETKRKISEGCKGKKASEKTKQKMRKPKSEEHRAKLKAIKQNVSEETKKKISESKKGKTPNRDYKAWAKTRQIPILQYDLDGNFIREWEGVKHAAKFLGCDPTTITAYMRKITKKGFGYLWKVKTI